MTATKPSFWALDRIDVYRPSRRRRLMMKKEYLLNYPFLVSNRKKLEED
jgi:hypothetical protein